MTADDREDRDLADLAPRLAEALEPVPPAAARAARLRERVLAIPARERAAAAGAPAFLNVLADTGAWLPIASRVSIKPLWSDGRRASYLVRMEAGAELPAHDHGDDEECLLVEGEVWLDDTLMRAGDYQLARRGSRHGRVRTETGCLLFVRGEHRAF